MTYTWIFAIVSLSVASPLAAQTLTLAGGKTLGTRSRHDSARVEANFNWKPDLWRSEDLSLSLQQAVSLGGFWDMNNVYFVSWAPNFILAPADRSGLYPYFQFGIGVALLSDDRFEYYDPNPWHDGQSDMGSFFQFENGLALGIVYHQLGVRAKIYHYSNLGFASPNGGMDVVELGIAYQIK